MYIYIYIIYIHIYTYRGPRKANKYKPTPDSICPHLPPSQELPNTTCNRAAQPSTVKQTSPPRNKTRKEEVITNTGAEDDGQQLGEGRANRLQPGKRTWSSQTCLEGSPESIFQKSPEFYLLRRAMGTHSQPPRQ